MRHLHLQDTPPQASARARKPFWARVPYMGVLGMVLPVGMWLMLWYLLSTTSPVPAPAPFWTVAQAAPRAQTLDTTVLVSGTLGVSPGVCAQTPTLYLEASDFGAANRAVVPCYTIDNQNANPVTVTITVDRGGPELVDLSSGQFVVGVGQRVQRTTYENPDFRPVSTERSFTATVFIQESVTGETGESTTRTIVNPIVEVDPQIEVIKTVGRDPDTCGTETSTVVPTNGTAYFCITLRNTGDVLLTQHTLNDTQLPGGRDFAYTLAPDATLVITNGVLSELGISGSLTAANLTGAIEQRATINSRAPGGIATADGTGTASVSVSRATVTLAKTIAFDPTTCTDLTNAGVAPESPFYYCIRVTNTGEVPLTSHALDEFLINIDLTFDYDLQPGQVMELTNTTLETIIGAEPQLGPFYLYQGPNNTVNFTMRYTGTNEIGSVASAVANAVVGPLPTPTPTFTPLPRSMPTLTPFPTNTPTETPIPDTPTPTFTPIPDTPTPTATPTPDLRVQVVQTPTPTPVSGNPNPTENQVENQTDAGPDSPLAGPANEMSAFDSPLAPPTETPTLTPTPTEMPTATPTISPTPPAPPTETPTLAPTATLPPTSTSTEIPTATPTAAPTEEPTAAVALIVVTSTPTPPDALLQLPPGQRPIVPPTPTPTPDTLMFLARTLDTAATAAVWIWLFAGSLVFFGAAGIVAGLFFRQNERRRFELFALDDDQWDSDEPEIRGGDPRQQWPRDLP